MEQFAISFPVLLFSVVSLLLLAYAIWFLVDALVVRNLNTISDENINSLLLEQVSNIRKRLRLTLTMQVVGFSCLLLCVVFVYFIFMYLYILAEMMLGISFGSGFLSGHLHH
ncbi:MAG TPA: DUF2721 domain-containing protein [Prolixibacteraceae bacterium]